MTYRYTLFREWDAARPTLVFLMLNPSTADVDADDPTVRKCIAYSKAWGYGRLEVRNLFALRSTDPKALLLHIEPIGPGNDQAIRTAVTGADVVAAWGNHGWFKARGMWVAREMLRPLARNLWHLGLTTTGHPKHPLYLRNDVIRTPWSPA